MPFFNKIKRLLARIKTRLYYSIFFKRIGKRSKIIRPLSLKNTKYITIGKNVTINDKVFMMVEKTPKYETPSLIIGDGCTFGNFNHIVSSNSVKIGNNVLTADRVYISDNIHEYEDIKRPISYQPIKSKRPTEIGDDCWLGENVCVICAKIGKHCVIGANSVVTSDIPDYSVAVGIPAKVIKQYDFDLGKWIKVKND